jgi:hypothetical protein
MTKGLVDDLYRFVLRREPDPEARRQAAARLDAGTLSRAGLLAELVASPSSHAFGRSRTGSPSREAPVRRASGPTGWPVQRARTSA